MKTKKQIKKRIYELADSFLVEAKDQDGNDRSLDTLNQDRHLFVDNMYDFLSKALDEQREIFYANELPKFEKELKKQWREETSEKLRKKLFNIKFELVPNTPRKIMIGDKKLKKALDDIIKKIKEL